MPSLPLAHLLPDPNNVRRSKDDAEGNPGMEIYDEATETFYREGEWGTSNVEA